MTVHEIRIADIIVGERRRQDFGDIDDLAKSIQTYGLLHPVIINSNRELILGERRLRAYIALGRTHIPSQIREELTGDKLREVELEENLKRKDLTPYERSKTLVELAPVVAAVISSASEEKDPRGRKSAYSAPKEDVAKRMGVGESTLIEAEQHVATAEAYPEFKQPQWNQATVLSARKALAKLPEEERGKAVAFVDEPGIPVKDAVGMIEELAAMPEAQREKVFALHDSDDTRDQDLAITTAAKKAHCPDPRAVWLRTTIREVKQWAKQFPDDPLTPRFEELADTMKFLADEATRLHKERIANAAG